MNIFDHALAIILIVGGPIYAWRTAAQMRRRAHEAGTYSKMPLYRQIIGRQWFLSLIMITLFALHKRGMSLLGLGFDFNLRFWLCTVAALVVFVVYEALTRRSMAKADARAKEATRMQRLRYLLPETRKELLAFMAVAITAGICEEVLYRGFLLWYFREWLSVEIAVCATVLVFAVGHIYQGIRGAIACGIAGSVFLGLYLAADSLLPGMLLHALLDIFGGITVYRLYREFPAPLASVEGVAASSPGPTGDTSNSTQPSAQR